MKYIITKSIGIQQFELILTIIEGDQFKKLMTVNPDLIKYFSSRKEASDYLKKNIAISGIYSINQIYIV